MASGAFAEDEALLIHHAIHSGAKTVALGKDEVYPITKYSATSWAVALAAACLTLICERACTGGGVDRRTAA